MPVDALASFIGHRKVKRLLALVCFLAALVLLRHLAVLVVFFLIFVGGLGFVGRALSRRVGLSEKVWVLIVVGVLLGGLGVGGYFGVHRSLPWAKQTAKDLQWQAAHFKDSDVYRMLDEAHLNPEKLGEHVKKFSGSLIKEAQSAGRALLHLLIGLIVAILFLVERDALRELVRELHPESFVGHLLAFFTFAAEAILLTVKVQVIVAAVNAVVTLPVMLVLGLPHVVALMLMVFAFGLVPVVGNFLSGVILSALAYMKKGVAGVAIFVISTFVLHKVESYYLNPRLVAQHVKLPSVLLIASLIVWEHLIGLAGIFVSFPALYVAQRIRDRFRASDAALLIGPAEAFVLPPETRPASVDQAAPGDPR